MTDGAKSQKIPVIKESFPDNGNLFVQSLQI